VGGAGVEAREVQAVRGGRGRVLVEVGRQDGLADADAADDRLPDRAGADEDDDLGGVGDGHGVPFSKGVPLAFGGASGAVSLPPAEGRIADIRLA
jgi:hypothetical protein